MAWAPGRSSAMSPLIPYEPPKTTTVRPSSLAWYCSLVSGAGRSAEVSWNSLSAI